MNTPRLIQPSDRFFLLNFPAINDGLVFSECVKIVNALRVRPDAADAVDFSEEIQAIEKLQAKIETHATPAGYHYESEPGTRCMVSGGEVVEIDRRMIEPDEKELPF